jgi:excisionase family DNA binding protein
MVDEKLGHKMGTAVKFPLKKQMAKKESRMHTRQSPLKKRLYSISEAATYLGRSDWSVRELIWGGKLPSVRVGRRVHLDIVDLDHWIEENKEKTFS